MIELRKVRKNSICLLCPGSNARHKEAYGVDLKGNTIKNADEVQFQFENEGGVFPYSGTISNISGAWKINIYSVLSNKHYTAEIGD